MIRTNTTKCHKPHTVFVSSMLTLSVMEADSQPNVVSHYGQVYRSQKVLVSRPMFIRLFFLSWCVLLPLKIFDTFFNTLYMGFRVSQHQRSMAPEWNEFWWLWWPIISGDGWGLSFPNICLTIEEKPHKKPQPGILTRLGIEPEPARWEVTMLPLDHSGGLNYFYFNI